MEARHETSGFKPVSMLLNICKNQYFLTESWINQTLNFFKESWINQTLNSNLHV